MNIKALISEQNAAGWLLVTSAGIFFIGAMLYTGRAIWKWAAASNPAYLRWERGFVIAAFLAAIMGFGLLERMLETAGDRIVAPSGMAILLIGSTLIIFAETFFISQREWIYSAIVTFVILAFLAQAAFGISLLRTGLLPAWVGWVTVLWNLGWMVVLPIARPKDMYYPWLHYVAPLLIGIVLKLNG